MNTVSRLDILLRRFLIVILFASILLGCVGAIVGIAINGYRDDDTYARVFLTPILGTLYACFGLMAVAVRQTGRARTLMLLGWVLLTLAAAGWLFVLWSDSARLSELLMRWAGTFTLTAMGLVVTCYLSSIPTPSQFLRVAAWCVAVLLDLLIIHALLMIWTEWWYRYSDVFGGVTFLWGVLVLVGMAVVPMLIRGDKRRRESARGAMPAQIQIELSCPECGEPQTLPTGLTRCRTCRFALLIQVEEPHCECGYLLYQLASDTCPECGRTLSAAERLPTKNPAGEAG